MRKLLPITVGLLALVAAGGGAYYYFAQKPFHALSSRPAVADYLPATTLLLLSAPDAAKTADNWKTTDLYKIWSEPEVQAFLAKPLSKLPATSDADAVLSQIGKLQPKNLFIALTALDDKNNQPHVLAGFQFKGDSKDVETLLAKPKAALRESSPGQADLINYQGRAIETYTMADGDLLASVFMDDWYLIGNDLPLIKSTVDRLDHRAPANSPALDGEADFQAVCARLPTGAETLIFARAQPFMGRIFSLAAATGQPIPADSRAQAEKTRALGAATRIEDGKIRDTMYVLSPDGPASALSLGSLPLTSADTLLYAAAALKIPAKFELPAVPGSSAAPVLAALDQWTSALAANGVSLASLRAALGDEASAQLEWPANSAQPELVASFALRDRAAAQKVLDGMIAVPLDGPAWSKSTVDNATFYTLTLPNVVFVSPTLTLTDKHLIVGISAPSVRAAATRERSGGGALAQTPGYKAATAAVGKPNVAFAYVDSKAFFERVYGVLKPAAVMGAALFVPQIGDYVDLAKLPATETVSKHLSPTVFSEAIDAQGITLESVGTLTLGQAIVGFTGGLGAAATPMLQKQLGGVASPAPAGLPAPAQKTPSSAPNE